MRKKRNWAGRRSTKERFVGLPHYLVMGKDGAGQAFRALSSNARSALIQIAARYNGVNNGLINASSRALALEMNVSRATAARAVRELIETGFVEVTEWGRFDLKDRNANAYRLAWRFCDRTNQPANKTFARGKDIITNPVAASRPVSKLGSKRFALHASGTVRERVVELLLRQIAEGD
jgi:hypothetical protein